jgi:hypothetical protein
MIMSGGVKMREKIEDVFGDFKLTVGTMKKESPETTGALLNVLRSARANKKTLSLQSHRVHIKE